MNKYNNPRLLNTVVSGTGMKHPVQPHVVVGDVSNGFIRGDLMDANAIVDLVNSGDAIDQDAIKQAVAEVIGTAPENLDTLGEVAETLTDMQDATKQGSLAYKIAAINAQLDETSPSSTIGKIKTDIQNIMSGVESLRESVGSSFDEVNERFTTVNTAIQNIQQTVEDNELTITASLNDLNSRITNQSSTIDGVKYGRNYERDIKTFAPYEIGDYLLDDLKTKVKQSEITEAQKSRVVGICIGANPITAKNVWWNVDSMTNSSATSKFYINSKFDPSKFETIVPNVISGYVSGMGAQIPYSLHLIPGQPGYITAGEDIKEITQGPSTWKFFYNDFAGLQNTIEWYKQATAAGINVSTDMPALAKVMGYANVDALTDSYDSWFLGSTGYMQLLTADNLPFGISGNMSAQSLSNYNTITTSLTNIGKTYQQGYYWGSSFVSQDSDYSVVHGLRFYSGGQYWNDLDADNGYRLFALIER